MTEESRWNDAIPDSVCIEITGNRRPQVKTCYMGDRYEIVLKDYMDDWGDPLYMSPGEARWLARRLLIASGDATLAAMTHEVRQQWDAIQARESCRED